MSSVTSPPSSTTSCGPLPPGNETACSVQSQYSSSVSPFQANTGTARLRDGGGRVILRGENIAARPAHVRAEFHQRLDEHRGLDRHVQRAGDAHALERLGGTEFLAHGHQAGHFVLGDGDFLAAPIGESEMSLTW